MDGFGAGLAALAFWGFIASIVVAGIWDGARKREAQHETLRRMIESGKPVDEALMLRLMVGEPKHPHRDLAVGAIVLFSIAVGLALLAAILRQPGVIGAAGVCACIAAGLLAASIYVRRTQAADARPRQQSDAR
ncbi:MAG TPA: hypothetical protein VGL98_04515 [Gammaproteobacteria bacterium]